MSLFRAMCLCLLAGLLVLAGSGPTAVEAAEAVLEPVSIEQDSALFRVVDETAAAGETRYLFAQLAGNGMSLTRVFSFSVRAGVDGLEDVSILELDDPLVGAATSRIAIEVGQEDVSCSTTCAKGTLSCPTSCTSCSAYSNRVVCNGTTVRCSDYNAYVNNYQYCFDSHAACWQGCQSYSCRQACNAELDTCLAQVPDPLDGIC
ncbi:MAG: hypothetical protein SX243_24555 [Acidobacteriota bacterium]|nr:hypothetical protein [Acidobacteriota bacterium]